MKNEWNLNARQMLFCQKYARCLNGTKAYRETYEDSTDESARRASSALLTNIDVQRYVEEVKRQIAVCAGITEESIAERWQALAHADPNELMQFRRGCCRFCHGVQHRYQWTPAEFEKHLKMERADAKKAGREMNVPDTLGGFGYNPRRDPHPDCPECYGEGEERVHFADTRSLSPGAKALFAGVKTTQHGIEIKVHDQFAALVKLAEYRGMSKKVNVQVGSVEGGPVQHTHTLTLKRAGEMSDDELAAMMSEGAEDGDSEEGEDASAAEV